MLRRIAVLVLLSAAVFELAGCYTVKGFGKDVRKAGDKIQEGAEEVKDKID